MDGTRNKPGGEGEKTGNPEKAETAPKKERQGFFEINYQRGKMNGSLKTKLDILANSRDYYRCVICGCDKHIETHHIIPGIEKLANLVTLCHSCHKKAHGMAGCFKRGRYDKRRKHKLSKTDVMVIKNMLGVKHKQVYIAKVFKVSPRTISDIYNGNTWSYV